MRQEKIKVHTIFISDIHLGSKGCKAKNLISFLSKYDAENYYLVGDIIDFWRMKKKANWTQDHNKVLKKFLKLSKNKNVVYVVGNHDEWFREHLEEGFNLGNIEVCDSTYYYTLDNKKLLVVHGDYFDGITQCAKWLVHLGDWSYNAVMTLNGWLNYWRKKLGLKYWSLSKIAKEKAKSAVNFIHNYEIALTNEAERDKCDGVVAGHIHKAALRLDQDIWYLNCGDWVDSCTAIVEHFDGTFELIEWTDHE